MSSSSFNHHRKPSSKDGNYPTVKINRKKLVSEKAVKGSSKYDLDNQLIDAEAVNDVVNVFNVINDDGDRVSKTQRNGVLSGKLMKSILKERRIRKKEKEDARNQDDIEINEDDDDDVDEGSDTEHNTDQLTVIKTEPHAKPAHNANLRSINQELNALKPLTLLNSKEKKTQKTGKSNNQRVNQQTAAAKNSNGKSKSKSNRNIGLICRDDIGIVNKWLKLLNRVVSEVDTTNNDNKSTSNEVYVTIQTLFQSGPLRFSKVADFHRLVRKFTSLTTNVKRGNGGSKSIGENSEKSSGNNKLLLKILRNAKVLIGAVTTITNPNSTSISPDATNYTIFTFTFTFTSNQVDNLNLWMRRLDVEIENLVNPNARTVVFCDVDRALNDITEGESDGGSESEYSSSDSDSDSKENENENE